MMATKEQVAAWIRPESVYYLPRTSVLALENTHNFAGGAVVPRSVIDPLLALAKEKGRARDDGRQIGEVFQHRDGKHLVIGGLFRDFGDVPEDRAHTVPMWTVLPQFAERFNHVVGPGSGVIRHVVQVAGADLEDGFSGAPGQLTMHPCLKLHDDPGNPLAGAVRPVMLHVRRLMSRAQGRTGPWVRPEQALGSRRFVQSTAHESVSHFAR